MTESDFENFAGLDSTKRMESLKEIRMIVCGIVLFNKDAGIGSTMDQNIPDCKISGEISSFLIEIKLSSFPVPKTLVKSYDSIESLLQFTLCDIMDRVNIVS